MSTFQNDFHSLVRNYLLNQGISPSDITDADGYLFKFGNRVVQLRLGEGGTMLVSTMVFYNERVNEFVLPLMITEFNAYHMLVGGYCLLVDAEQYAIYVEQELIIRRLDVESLKLHLLAFCDRADSCTLWYTTQVQQSIAA